MKHSPNHSPAYPRGVVEGFYGVFYTHPERIDLIRFIGRHGFNLYVYAPKNDRQQRARWWEPYPRSIMAQFGETVRVAHKSGVRFCYAISPGGSICYSDSQDFSRLMAKMHDLVRAGVRDFSLMLDDNHPGFKHTIDERRYGTLFEAQSSLANRLYAWLLTLDPVCTLSLVPAEYYGRAPFSRALVGLASRLHPDIDLCYTGPEICSREITTEDARAFARATGRKPLIWDNSPANDLAMQPDLHLGPVTGREPGLVRETKGYLVNPMNLAEASKVPLLTFAAYLSNPLWYDPPMAWQAALREVAGEGYALSLRILAENTHGQGLRLDRLARSAEKTLREGKHSVPGIATSSDLSRLDAPAVRELEDYLSEIDEAGYALKFRMDNLALRNNLLPWIEVLEHWMWMARFALRVLRALEEGSPYMTDLQRVYEYQSMIRAHHKRIASQALEGIVDYTIEQVVKDQRQRVKSVTTVGRLS
jgi:hyaluronoglucosaminidase